MNVTAEVVRRLERVHARQTRHREWVAFGVGVLVGCVTTASVAAWAILSSGAAL